MLKMGVSRGSLKGALQLLSNSSISTVQAEEGHVHAAVLLRMHRKYSTQTLVARALVSSAGPLLAVAESDRRVAVARAAVERATRKTASHMTGRQLYVRELIGVARRQGFERYGGGQNVARRVISKHGRTWAALTPAQKHVFEVRSYDARAELRHAQAENLALAQETLRLELQRVGEAARSSRPPLRMSSCTLSSFAQSEYDNLYKQA